MSTSTEEEITPIPIHITGISKDVLPGRARRRMKTTYETYVLTAAEPAQNILPQEPKRYSYHILAVDNDIIIGPTKGVVAAAVNLVANVPTPNGAYYPKGLWREFEDNGQVYIGATTVATNTRVTVIAEYYEE
jgi:hypothetical protein